jgi:hypothetical protein
LLNPRSYFKDELWQQAPVLTGSTKFDLLPDAKNILITGGAGFMYVRLGREMTTGLLSSMYNAVF